MCYCFYSWFMVCTPLPCLTILVSQVANGLADCSHVSIPIKHRSCKNFQIFIFVSLACSANTEHLFGTRRWGKKDKWWKGLAPALKKQTCRAVKHEETRNEPAMEGELGGACSTMAPQRGGGWIHGADDVPEGGSMCQGQRGTEAER